MRFGLRTTILALLLVAARSAPVAAVVEHAHLRTVPETLSGTDRLITPGRVELSVPPTHVAFSWKGGPRSGVEYRTVSSLGTAGSWTRAPEAHDLDHGKMHYSAVIAVDRPTAMDWRRLKPRGPWMGPVTFDYINTLDGEREIVPQASGAEAAVDASPGTPDIVSRAEWGADESIKKTTGTCKRRFFPVQQLFVHHTAGTNFDVHPQATMRAIYWYHTVRRGWCDIGYNFVIGRDGTIYEGRWARPYHPWEEHTSEDGSGRGVVGAHVANYNSGSVGISLMGNYEITPVPPDMRRSLAELLAWEVDRHNLKPLGSHTYRNPETGLTRKLPYIAGHRDAGQTACPGKFTYSSLPEVRRDTKAVIGAGKKNSAITFAASPLFVNYGQTVPLSGTLVAEDAPLDGRTVTLYERVGSKRWKEKTTAVTSIDGTFSFTLTPTQGTKVLAVYDGDASTWGSQSDGVNVKVRHVVTLTPQGAGPDAGGLYHFPTAATSITFSGTTAPIHVGRAVTISVRRLNSDGSYTDIGVGSTPVDDDGTFTFTFLRPDVGVSATYVTVARMAKDERHAFGASTPVSFVTDVS
jgi:N-acetylmuramoyl-L-alanine amidase